MSRGIVIPGSAKAMIGNLIKNHNFSLGRIARRTGFSELTLTRILCETIEPGDDVVFELVKLSIQVILDKKGSSEDVLVEHEDTMILETIE